MQLEFKDFVADLGRDSKYLRTWVRLISGIIRNLVGGAALETFLDNHLDREKYTPCMRPSFLEHPDLDIGDMPPGLGSPASLASSGEIQGDQQPEQGDEPENPFATSQNLTKYSHLPEESVRLDMALFISF